MKSPVDSSQLQLDLDHIRRRRIGQFIFVMLGTILSLALFLLHKRHIDVAGASWLPW